MKIYVKPNTFECYTTNPDGTLLEYNTPFFDSKCATFIEGYRFIPEGQSWIREDGVIFHGEMIAPWKEYDELDNIQRKYEKNLYLEYKEALEVMGVEV
jgi:hypothetical protein